jgi:hypothetical protein
MHTNVSANTRNMEQTSEFGQSEDMGMNIQQLMDDRSNFIRNINDTMGFTRF